MKLRFRVPFCISIVFALLCGAALPLHADLSGTYSADDGGIYYVQQSGGTLWWAGMSLDSGLTADKIWHRGLEFTNVFRGTISGNTITGEWVDVTRGSILQSGALSLTISGTPGAMQFTKTSATGGFGASAWTQTGALDDSKFNGKTLSIIGRMDAVHKNEAAGSGSLTDNLKTYRDQTVVYGRVVNEHVDGGSPQTSLPHIAYGPQVLDQTVIIPFPFPHFAALPYYDFSQPPRDFQTFSSWNQNDGNGDGDIDLGLSLDTGRLEDFFWNTGWGNRGSGPTVFSLKFGYSGDQSQLGYASFIHPEGIMYGWAYPCDLFFQTCSPNSLLPGWADTNGNSILINGEPMNGSVAGSDCNGFTEPCPFLGGATSTNYLVTPIGIELKKLLLSQYGGGNTQNVDSAGNVSDSAGAYVRITGNLVVDCGHGATHPCFDETDDPDGVAENQNQEIHPIYSIDVINKPYRPEDFAIAGRANYTGAWGGSDGSTYYIRQVGNTVWWLSMLRDRQPMQDGTGNNWQGCNGSGSPSGIIGTCQLAPAFNAGNPACDSPGQCWAFATVFKGTITHTTFKDIIDGDWVGVPQSASKGSTGGHMTFYALNNKSIAPASTGSIFPPSIDKMYDPADNTPPATTLTIGSPQYFSSGATQPFVSSATPFSLSASDVDSGLQNVWYRYYAQGATPGAYTPVVASATTFNLTGSDGGYEADAYSTDNAGNDSSTKSVLAYLDATAPVATMTQPSGTQQYTHADILTLNYSVSDGNGSGVKSSTPKLDGSTTFPDGTLITGTGQSFPMMLLSIGTHTFSVDSTDNVGNTGTSSVAFTIAVTPDGVIADVNQLLSFGCIDSGGIANSLIVKISAVKDLIAKGQIQTAINVLAAFVNEVQAQSGIHVVSGCSVVGHTVNAGQLLIGDAQYLQGTLSGQLKPDPIVGYITAGGAPVAGVSVNLMNSAKSITATTTTDSSGFYYFADVSMLATGTGYTLAVVLPKGYKSSTPASQAFTWSAATVKAATFGLN